MELPKDVADKWLAPIRAAEERRSEEEKAAEREHAEKKNKADADLKRAAEQFQAAEQRASQAYQSATKGTLSGQVFVSTVGGENFKLGAVQVGLFARDAIDALIPELKRYADSKIEGRGLGGIYRSGSFYFGYLQNPIQTAETDGDGRFVIEVPQQGAFVIGAQAQRSVGDSTEHYYWLQPVSLGGQQKFSQNLSNNNLTSTTGTSSLIHTKD